MWRCWNFKKFCLCKQWSVLPVSRFERHFLFSCHVRNRTDSWISRVRKALSKRTCQTPHFMIHYFSKVAQDFQEKSWNIERSSWRNLDLGQQRLQHPCGTWIDWKILGEWMWTRFKVVVRGPRFNIHQLINKPFFNIFSGENEGNEKMRVHSPHFEHPISLVIWKPRQLRRVAHAAPWGQLLNKNLLRYHLWNDQRCLLARIICSKRSLQLVRNLTRLDLGMLYFPWFPCIGATEHQGSDAKWSNGTWVRAAQILWMYHLVTQWRGFFC